MSWGPIVEKILQCPWASAVEKEGLLRGIGQMTAQAKTRPKLQDYENLASFISAEQWRLLLDSEKDYHGKASLLCDHAVSLGLRHPSEPTLARMVGLLMVCIEGADKARGTSGQYLRDVFLNLKSMLKSRCKVGPFEVILALGSDVAKFAAAFPGTFAAAFPRGPPVSPEVKIAEVAIVSQGISMRDRQKVQQPSSLSPSAGMDPFQAMVQQVVAQSLQNVFNLGGSSSSSSSHMHLDSGVRLQMFGRGRSSASLSPLQQPAIALPPALLALPPPEPVAAAPTEAAAPPQEADVASDAEEVLPPRRKMRKTVDEATAAILDAMGKKSTVALSRPAAAPAAVLGEVIDVGSSRDPSFGVEATRSQVMLRTGLMGKGQTTALKFHNEASKKACIAEAKQLVAEERRRRHL